MFRQYGISPSGVIGHSSGEIAAAYAARALLMKEAIVAAYFRGLIMKHHTRSGAMAAIGMGSEAQSQVQVDNAKSLQIGQYGMMDSLQFLQHQAGIVQSHEVEVQIRSTGLNFRV